MRREDPLTVVGLAHTAFSQRTSCSSHVVIATAKLGTTTITWFTLMGLRLMVDFRDLKRKPEVGKLGINLVFSGELGLSRGSMAGKGKSQR